jgi:hypothetical protein
MGLNEFAELYYRPATGDIRFTAPMLMQALGKEHARVRADVLAQIAECGALHLPSKAAINGRATPVRRVLSVKRRDWAAFVANLRGMQVIQEIPAGHRLTLAQRVARIEQMLGIVD